jgi:putative tryptophan/tyrosine transport system substrate-binding protein
MKSGIRHGATGNSLKAKVFGFALCALVLALCFAAQAQQPTKVAKIGELRARPGSRPSSYVLLQALRELGYVEGKNIAFETRYTEGKRNRFPDLADELVRLKVDVLLASSTNEALAFKSATRIIPIVFTGSGDPVAAGLVDSLARPGGNLTGFTTIGAVLTGKRLELLKETIPKLSRVAVLWDPRDPNTEQQWKESQLAARELGLQLHSVEVTTADKLESAFKEATKAHSAALTVTETPLTTSNQKQIADLAAKNRLPAIYSRRDFVESGGLMSYGPDRTEVFRRVASMIDKILKGTKPADIPVEQPTKFELVINLKTAKGLGLTIPPIVMMRAEKVIK